MLQMTVQMNAIEQGRTGSIKRFKSITRLKMLKIWKV